MRPALSIDWHTLLEEDLVAHFVDLPYYQEDETVPRETLEKLGCSPSAEKHMRMVSLENLSRFRSAEKHMRIVLAIEAREGPNTSRQSRASHGDDWPPFRGDDGQLLSVGFPTALEEMWCGTSPARIQQCVDTFWHPQFFSTVTFESQL